VKTKFSKFSENSFSGLKPIFIYFENLELVLFQQFLIIDFT
jgi:hypothetical protein